MPIRGRVENFFPAGAVEIRNLTVEYAAFVPPNSRVLVDQICTAFGPEVNCVRQVNI